MKIINIIGYLFYYTGITLLFRFLNRNRKKILAYHNIIEDKYYDNKLHLGVSIPESIFAVQFAYIINKYKINNDLKNTAFITFTFDDGYLNQYYCVKKYFISQKIPCYLFCQSDFTINNKSAITDQILLWISYCNVESFTLFFDKEKRKFEIVKDIDRDRIWRDIYGLLIRKQITQQQILFQLNKIEHLDSIIKRINEDYYKKRFLKISIKQVNELCFHGIKIGCHSKSHEILSMISEKELIKEVENSEKNKYFNTNVFAYPFGDEIEVNEKVINTVKKSGYDMALSNTNKYSIQYNDYFIPRLSLSCNDNIPIIEFELSGAKYFLKYRRLFPKF
jgi:peptidoglycan/xylan/chitin deacetylase (PgdA/CDA1 family)